VRKILDDEDTHAKAIPAILVNALLKIAHAVHVAPGVTEQHDRALMRQSRQDASRADPIRRCISVRRRRKTARPRHRPHRQEDMTFPHDTLSTHHGGNLALARARYGTPPQGWLDLSTGINPVAYPAAAIDSASLAPLPDPDTLQALIATARETYRVPSGASLLAVPGSEIALRLLPFIMPDGQVAIVGPTYGSHDEVWAARQPVSAISGLDRIPPAATIVVLTNPNNPDGRTLPGEDVARSTAALAGRGGMLIVDEAFADLHPDASLAPFLDGAPAIVLRSFGKFFGLAGLRLGFVAGPPTVADRLRHLLGAWPVSGAAIAIGQAALGDHGWQSDARSRLAAAAERLRTLLARHGLRVAGGTDLFILVELPDAARLHARLAEAGIWTRIFPYRSDWLRLGLPAGEAGFARLDAAFDAAADLIARLRA
jgi:cobalamin biosynthetic protein CobC